MTRSTHAPLAVLVTALCFTPAVRALDCVAATTQADMAACAYEDHQAASAEQAEAMRGYTGRLSSAERQRWRAAQKAWLGWRTAQCAFESGSLGAGSARETVNWRCVVRLTRERTAAIARVAACPEGDLACPGSRR